MVCDLANYVLHAYYDNEIFDSQNALFPKNVPNFLSAED